VGSFGQAVTACASSCIESNLGNLQNLQKQNINQITLKRPKTEYKVLSFCCSLQLYFKCN